MCQKSLPGARPRPDDRAHARTRRTHDDAHPTHMTHSAAAERRTARPKALPTRMTSFFLLEAVLSSLPTGQTRPTSTFWTRRRDIRAPSMVRLLTCAPFAQRSPEREKSTRRQIDDFSGLRIGERSEPRKK